MEQGLQCAARPAIDLVRVMVVMARLPDEQREVVALILVEGLGYRDTADYWNRASAKHVLDEITVPTLVLNACNDPFLPERHLPRSASSSVTLEYPTHGGHVGFTSGRFPGELRWLPGRIIDFLNGFDSTGARN